MSTWKLLEGAVRGAICETAQYRGDTYLRLKDLEKMTTKPGEEPARLDPNGGSIEVGAGHQFDPGIWKGWQNSIGLAMASAASSKSGESDQYAGRSQGGTMTKKNYGGSLSYDKGKSKSDYERLPSAMDRYDVLMVADITSRVNKSGKTVQSGVLKRAVYSPSIGSSDERAGRLKALLAGEAPHPLKRRPQAEVPGLIIDPKTSKPVNTDMGMSPDVKKPH